MIQDTLLFCTAAPLVLGFASAWDTRTAVRSKWYQGIRKPWFNPPRYVFAPIWIYLYISTGYALFLVRRAQLLSDPASTIAAVSKSGIYVFWTQLLANLLWSSLYFVQKEIGLALIDISLLSFLSVVTTACFMYVKPLAGLLMVPYVAWALYATALTYSVKKLNPDFKEEAKQSD